MENETTETRVPLPRPGKDFNTAKRLYMEQFGSALVTNNYLRVAVAGISIVAAGLVWLNFKTHQTFENFKPLVIRISDVGRAEALSYDSFRWEPQDAEIRYFLIQFVTKHYSRRRATIREAWAESLYFLDGRLADAAIEANRKNKTIETFLAGVAAHPNPSHPRLAEGSSGTTTGNRDSATAVTVWVTSGGPICYVVPSSKPLRKSVDSASSPSRTFSDSGTKATILGSSKISDRWLSRA